jgi:hypothetical protein
MRFRALLVPVPVALLAAPAAQAYPTFYGTAGPTSTIVLKRANGTVVKNTSRGNKTFVIRDRSTSHNFHLYGPGVDRRTRVAFVGTRTWSPLLLRIGRYTIVCDRHPSTMIRRFNVS